YNDENNIDNKIMFYKTLLSSDLIPIADLPGGDLNCIGVKNEIQNKIYIWFHEMNGENIYLISPSFESIILKIKRIRTEKSNLANVKLDMSNKLIALLNNLSKKD